MLRRITTLVLAVAFLAGCGSGGGHFANLPRPPSPVNVTVYIDDHRVSISPSSVGAGPVVFLVTNQASKAQSITILPAGVSAGQALADTGPISPQATTQVTVDLNRGRYSVATGPTGATEAAQASPGGIAPAMLNIGKKRPSASGQLLNP